MTDRFGTLLVALCTRARHACCSREIRLQNWAHALDGSRVPVPGRYAGRLARTHHYWILCAPARANPRRRARSRGVGLRHYERALLLGTVIHVRGPGRHRALHLSGVRRPAVGHRARRAHNARDSRRRRSRWQASRSSPASTPQVRTFAESPSSSGQQWSTQPTSP